jgi:hypothetical protein
MAEGHRAGDFSFSRFGLLRVRGKLFSDFTNTKESGIN